MANTPVTGSKALGELDLVVGTSNTLVVTAEAMDKYKLAESDYSDAENITAGDVVYESNGDGTCRVIQVNNAGASTIAISSRGAEGDIVTEIADGVFNGMTSLVKVTIPYTIKKIGANAFAGCSSLAEVVFNDYPSICVFLDVSGFPEGCGTPTILQTTGSSTQSATMNLFDADRKIFYCDLIYGNTEKISFSVKEGTTTHTTKEYTIDEATHDELCNGLFRLGDSSPTLSAGRTYDLTLEYHWNPGAEFLGNYGLSIGEGAFMGSGIEELSLPRRIVKIGAHAFRDCLNLHSLVVPKRNRLVKIEAYAFRNCVSLGAQIDEYSSGGVNIENGLEEIGESAFLGCTGLFHFTIPATVKKIGNAAFVDLTDLQNVTIRSSEFYGTRLESIGAGAFQGCNKLGLGRSNRFVIPKSVTYIGERAFNSEPYYEGNGYRFFRFEYPYTWFRSSNADPSPEEMELVEPSLLYSDDTEGDYNHEELLNGVYLTSSYTELHWHKLSKMPRPEISINKETNTLEMTDKLGIADKFFIYVNLKSDGDYDARVEVKANVT